MWETLTFVADAQKRQIVAHRLALVWETLTCLSQAQTLSATWSSNCTWSYKLEPGPKSCQKHQQINTSSNMMHCAGSRAHWQLPRKKCKTLTNRQTVCHSTAQHCILSNPGINAEVPLHIANLLGGQEVFLHVKPSWASHCSHRRQIDDAQKIRRSTKLYCTWASFCNPACIINAGQPAVHLYTQTVTWIYSTWASPLQFQLASSLPQQRSNQSLHICRTRSQRRCRRQSDQDF